MASKKGKRVVTTVYFDPEQLEALKRLHEKTRIPVSVFIREAVDDLLVKYKKELKS